MGNLIIIQDYFLKSLFYYNENFIKLIKEKKGFTRRHINFNMEKTRRFKIRGNFRKLLKKNSSKVSPFSESTIRIIGERRSGSILNFDTIKKTIRIQSILNGEPRESNFSLLKQKNFFKKLNSIDEIENENDTEKDSSEKEKEEINEEVKKQESIYLQLIKALFDGKFKVFKNIYTNNKAFIDINQILIDGNTLLIMAVKEGNYQITKFLCEEQADVNIQNVDGNTALHYAIGKQFYSIADILTMHGAKEDLVNLRGLSPWDCIENYVD